MNCHSSDYVKFANPDYYNLRIQIEEAQEKLRIARQEEAYADEKHLDIAIENVGIAMAILNNLYKRAKLI